MSDSARQRKELDREFFDPDIAAAGRAKIKQETSAIRAALDEATALEFADAQIREVKSAFDSLEAFRPPGVELTGVLPVSETAPPQELPRAETKKQRSVRRWAAYGPKLTEKGLSPHSWETAAGIGHGTARKFMNGSTKKLQGSREPLAKALGLKTAELRD